MRQQSSKSSIKASGSPLNYLLALKLLKSVCNGSETEVVRLRVKSGFYFYFPVNKRRYERVLEPVKSINSP